MLRYGVCDDYPRFDLGISHHGLTGRKALSAGVMVNHNHRHASSNADPFDHPKQGESKAGVIDICDRFTNKRLFVRDRNGNLVKDRFGNLEKVNYDNEPSATS